MAIPINKRAFITKLIASGFLLTTLPCRSHASLLPGVDGFLRTNWSTDPFSFGSYSFIAKRSSRRDHQKLSEPVNSRLFFAGEAANGQKNSTVHAAYEAGIRAAKEIAEQGYSKIAIIGAGIAGLSAAQNLSARGVEVTLLEARKRIGGRIHTDHSLGIPLDLGASWVHGINKNPLTQLARQAGMPYRMTDETWIARDAGNNIDEDDLPDWMDDVTEFEHTAGAAADEINLWAYLFHRDYGGEEIVFPSGYDQIFKSLEGSYETRLQTTIDRIEYNERTVRLFFKGGDLNTEAVIITVPLGVLKKGSIAFDPPLPVEKQAAINRLGMGILDKVYLRFEEVFWDKEPTWILTPFNNQPRGQFNNWLNVYKLTGEPVLMAFNGGSAALALARLEDEKVKARAIEAITSAYDP